FLVIAYNLDFKIPEWKIKRDKAVLDDLDIEETLPIISDTKSEQIELSPSFNREKKESTSTVNSTFERQAVAKEPVVSHVGVVEQELTLKAESSSFELEIDDESKESPDLAVEEVLEEKKSDADVLVEKFGQYDPQLDLSNYKYPHLGLLRDYGTGKIVINNAELEANKDRIVDTLANYNIEIEKIKATIGPTVTLYEIVPKPGVRISKIKNLEDDIALSLAALGIRIIAPMPGKGTIGIEVPNSQPEMVSMRSVIATEKFQHTDMDLPIAFGKTITNEVFIADLAKMPHLLVAG